MSGNEFKIAIVGMAGVFPESDSISELWASLLEKKILVRNYTLEELSPEACKLQRLHGENFLPFRGSLKHPDYFDHEFFKISFTDAVETDPQQRLLLQVAYNALRDSGLAPERLDSRNIGVYASCSPSTYEQILKDSRSGSDIMSFTGCLRDLIASRISYTLNLHGPAVNVQTGCSSSLSAVYEATKALLSNECNIALVGASSIRFPQNNGHVYQDGGIYSKDGLCRPFDESSSGTVSGNGCVAVILKRYEDALTDGDRIYCAINTIMANNDGSRKASIAAPSVDGQFDLISEVLSVSGVDPKELAFIETHGTATALGDAVEIAALTKALSDPTSTGSCAIGSIKANIGHLDSTSGLAGLVKAALSLYTGIYPGHPSFQRPNATLDLNQGPFFVNTENLLLPPDKKFAALNSLGIGGTNVFALLEKAHTLHSVSQTEEAFLPIRLRAPEQISTWADSIKRFLALNPQLLSCIDASDLPGSEQSGLLLRREDGQLRILSSRNILKRKAERIAFVFPGGGSYYKGALHQLKGESPAIREHLEHVLSLLSESEEAQQLNDFFSDSLSDKMFDDLKDNPTMNLLVTFIINHVTASALLDSGIVPQFLIGHSLGEYNALVLSRRLDLGDALKIVKKRGEIFAKVMGYRLINLSCGESSVLRLSPSPQIIAYNSENNLTVVIPEKQLESFIAQLNAQKVEYSPVSINVPAHSTFLDPYLDDFRQFLKGFQLSPGKFQIISNVTGLPLQDEFSDLNYLADHLRTPVKFSQGVSCLLSQGVDTLIQVGVGFGLISSLSQGGILNTLSSLGSDLEGETSNFKIISHLLRLPALRPGSGPQPSYPFLLRKCWPKQIKTTSALEALPYLELCSAIRSFTHAQNPVVQSSVFESFEVFEWEKNIEEVASIFNLLGKLRGIDEALSSPKMLYLVRRRGEQVGELLPLRSFITSFNIESRFLSVKIVSLSRELKSFDFHSYHANNNNLECSYLDGKFEWGPVYAHYAPQARPAKPGKTAVIVGGLGRVGIRLCEKILSERKKDLILCGRSSLTDSELLKRLSSFPKLVSAFRAGKLRYECIISGEQLAGLVGEVDDPESVVFCASGTDKDSIRKTIEEIQEKDFFEQMESKWTLYRDFSQTFDPSKSVRVIFISSNASRLSGPGMMTYSYASAMVDKLPILLPHVCSISFDAFRFRGEDLAEVTNFTDADGLYQAYAMALNADLGVNIILSNQLFSQRIEEWVRAKNAMLTGDFGVDVSKTSVVDAIAATFGEMLGLDTFGPDVDFFLSGGHSLLAFRVLARLNSLYGLRLSMKQIKLNSTPRRLSGVVEEILKTKQSSEAKTKADESLDIDKLLAEFDS